jgi:putative ABC transport system permease protein
MNPTILGVRLSMLFRFYGWRLRRQTAQELLAGSGIAVGVALVFGVLVANTNLTSSATRLVHELGGGARLALVARSAGGFDERLAEEAGRLPGVRVAAGLLRENVTLGGPRGRQMIQLVGLSVNDIRLGGVAQHDYDLATLLLAGGVGIAGEVAATIGVGAGRPLTVLFGGDTHGPRVHAVLGETVAGAGADSAIGVTVLWLAQALTGMPGRVTEVLVEPRPGAQRLVAGELRRLAAGHLDVVAADDELRLLAQATQPSAQSTALFSAISVMVGMLLALNAMLLTVPERRRFVADLRMQGYDRRQVLLLLGFEALMLGVVASLVGVALGDVLFRVFFQRTPAYLANAFPIGTQQALHLTTVLVAVACGVLATGLASLPLVFDLRAGRPADAVFRQAGGSGEVIEWRVAARLGVAGAALAAVVTALIVIDPGLTIVGGVALALTTLCLVPIVFAGVASILPRACEGIRSGALVVAVSELRATTTRSVALAGIAALAVYGSVAIGGARDDLVRGIGRATAQYFGTADLWVTAGDDIFNTDSFKIDGTRAAIARVPGVASVRVYQGGLLDVGTRRLWVRARSPQDPAMLESTQIVSGSVARATDLLRRGGWVAISSGLADEDRLHVGEAVSLPTPSGPVRFGVAAIMTNSGWPPGTITIDSDDYRRYWQTSDAAALEVTLGPGASAAGVRRAIEAALVGRPGLLVRTSGERDAENKANANQGLRTLGDISTLLLVAAALAIASALTAAVWQRRARLAALKIQGYDHRQLWRALLFESAIMLGLGSVIGATVGVYGHALASRWLKLTTGFPAPFSIGPGHVVLTLVLVTGIALAVIALPGLVAARVPARASFQE